MEPLIPLEVIEKKIFLIRRQKVMLDRDLADLYEVETRVLNQAVQRNIKRFPEDFMFSLTREEIMRISQIVISSDIKYSKQVRAVTEQGVAMLSGILNSDRAIDANIQIMRAFVKLRQMIATNKDLTRRLNDLEKKYDGQFHVVFEAIRQLMAPPKITKRKIGFHLKEKQAGYGRK
ncbi:MAG: ORF6N domain-containing protein [Deltaproteobacteria bacterium]|nr:ORF6N domain-containing protein [Deltaproteobacteria bacterium]